MHAQTQPMPPMGYAIVFAAVAVVFALRLRGTRRARPLRLETMWVLPALYLAVATAMFVERPPTPAGWGWCAAALALGAGIGWQRGKTMRIAVDPETHRLSQQSSPLAVLLLLALVVLRQVARVELGGGAAAARATGMAIAFGVGLLVATRAEMFTRARRLLRAARAA